MSPATVQPRNSTVQCKFLASPLTLVVIWNMNLTSKPCSTSSRPAVYRTACEKACAPSPLSATLANSAPASPFFATLTDNSQVAENTATLSPFPAALSDTVNHKSFVCQSLQKTPRGGYPPFAPARFPVPRSFPTFKLSNLPTILTPDPQWPLPSSGKRTAPPAELKPPPHWKPAAAPRASGRAPSAPSETRQSPPPWGSARTATATAAAPASSDTPPAKQTSRTA